LGEGDVLEYERVPLNRFEAVHRFEFEPLQERDKERGWEGGRDVGIEVDWLSVGDTTRAPHRAQQTFVVLLLIPGIMGVEFVCDNANSAMSVLSDTGSITT
jgi:hypothetical protein